MKVLVACEFSGVVRDAFRRLGHDAYSCDILSTPNNSNYHIKDDVMNHLNDGWDMMIAHPPCTYLTITGNKWFYHPDDHDLPVKDRRPHPRFPNRQKHRVDAIKFFLELGNIKIDKICVENPVGIMSTFWRKPDQIIQPFEFGHTEAKKTCLWLKNLPKLISTKIVTPEYTVFKSGKRMATWYMNAVKLPPKEREMLRSTTFQGIAEAMADQWGSQSFRSGK